MWKDVRRTKKIEKKYSEKLIKKIDPKINAKNYELIYNKKLPEKRFLNHLNNKTSKKKYNPFRNWPKN